MIKIGNRIEVEVGQNIGETQVRFDGVKIGGVMRLTIDLNADEWKPRLEMEFCNFDSVRPPRDFVAEMARNGFSVLEKKIR